MSSKLVKQTILALLFTCPSVANAQFNTIRKKDFIGYEILQPKDNIIINSDNQSIDSPQTIREDIEYTELSSLQEDVNPSKKEAVRKKHLEYSKQTYINTTEDVLPELTIPNLLAEIRKNGIRHEKVVLAQAILETGWFSSSVCRNKNNLFGLTNPRTGKYYEFNHWTESVRAYYTKVQYRYKDKDENYLLWLDRIGYAEDPRYVSSLISILRQYML